ncbi:MAG: PAS domain-containing protein [bacterium]|nr:PAS domain-containing protein [bacterium]
MKNKSYKYSIGVCSFFICVFILFQADFCSAQNAIIELKDGWSYHWGDSRPHDPGAWSPLKTPGQLLRRDNRKIAWFRITLPEGNWKDPCIHVHRVDQVFEVYINNRIIYRFGEIEVKGERKFPGSPSHMIPLDPGFQGKDVFFRVYSNYRSIGINSTVLIGSRADLIIDKIKRNSAGVIQSHWFLFVGVLVILFSLVYRNQLPFFSFGFLSLSLGVFGLARTRIPLLFIDFPIPLIYIQLISLYLVPVGAGLLVEGLFGAGYKSIVRRVWQFYLAFACSALVLSYCNVISLVSSIPYFLFSLVPGILIFLFVIFFFVRKGNLEAKIFLGGFVILAVCSILDIFESMNFISFGGGLTHWGFSGIFLAIILILVYRIFDVRLNLVKLNRDLEQKIEDLDDANRQISLSEEKYRFLVEGSNDVVFSLDEDFNFITANRAIASHLNLSPQMVKKKNFLDLLYEDVDGVSVTRQIIMEKREDLIKNKEPISFTGEFKTPITTEPKEMAVRLEYINIEGKNQILGKASRLLDDSLVKYFISENQHFIIGNYLITADDITHRITGSLKRYMISRNINLLRIALREIIINSVEHGNLDITYHQKTGLIIEGKYLEFIARRQNDPACSEKRVYIKYSIDPEKAVYTITDEGEGFDHQKILNANMEDINEEMLVHGRGILMAREIFNKIEYNEKGNEVVLTKYYTE